MFLLPQSAGVMLARKTIQIMEEPFTILDSKKHTKEDRTFDSEGTFDMAYLKEKGGSRKHGQYRNKMPHADAKHSITYVVVCLPRRANVIF